MSDNKELGSLRQILRCYTNFGDETLNVHHCLSLVATTHLGLDSGNSKLGVHFGSKIRKCTLKIQDRRRPWFYKNNKHEPESEISALLDF